MAEKTDLSKVPPHMKMDYEKRNGNIDMNNPLCTRCAGTGNELYSMLKVCLACEGTGIAGMSNSAE